MSYAYLSGMELAELERPLNELLRHVTYRPGWEFTIFDGTLHINATVIDSKDPSREIPLTFAQKLPLHVPASFDWARWLFEQITRVERHEAREFFQIDGVPPYDPHAGEENQNGRR